MKKHLPYAYLLTGSNMGDRLRQLATAKAFLNAEAGRVVRQSAVYETAAWGREGLPPHLNQALCLETPLEPLALLHHTQQIEQRMGRIKDEKWGVRLIDIDILYFNDRIVHYPELCIPHPLLQKRRFALVPLNEIAATVVHPVLRISTTELLAACTDPLSVRKLKAGDKEQ